MKTFCNSFCRNIMHGANVAYSYGQWIVGDVDFFLPASKFFLRLVALSELLPQLGIFFFLHSCPTLPLHLFPSFFITLLHLVVFSTKCSISFHCISNGTLQQTLCGLLALRAVGCSILHLFCGICGILSWVSYHRR